MELGSVFYHIEETLNVLNFNAHLSYKMFEWVLLYDSYKIVSEYDQEMPQSQTADNPTAPRGRATQPS